jgi:hypothetical protein
LLPASPQTNVWDYLITCFSPIVSVPCMLFAHRAVTPLAPKEQVMFT